MPHPFEFDPLWNKAKLFMERGLNARADQKHAEWPLWASLAAELLGKAALARRHPALVANPGTEQEATSLLSAVGAITTTSGLKSIGMSTVVSRLGKIIPTEFDKHIQDGLNTVANFRNEELHSGATPFTDLNEHTWAPRFWKAVEVLLNDSGKTVAEFVGPDFAELVTNLIATTNAEIVAEVEKRIGQARQRWKVRAEDNGGEAAYREAIQARLNREGGKAVDFVTCPVCKCEGYLRHNWTILSEVRRIVDDRIFYEHRCRAESFDCDGCSLHLEGTAQLVKAELPMDVTVLDDFSQDWEPDYGND